MAKLGRCPVQDKVSFDSWGDCVHRILIRSSKSGEALRPYFHATCGKYHMTKTSEYRGSAAC